VVDHDVSDGVHSLLVDCCHQLNEIVFVAVLAAEVVQLACSSSSSSSIVALAHVSKPKYQTHSNRSSSS
jgi:hypothetical protein